MTVLYIVTGWLTPKGKPSVSLTPPPVQRSLDSSMCCLLSHEFNERWFYGHGRRLRICLCNTRGSSYFSSVSPKQRCCLWPLHPPLQNASDLSPCIFFPYGTLWYTVYSFVDCLPLPNRTKSQRAQWELCFIHSACPVSRIETGIKKALKQVKWLSPHSSSEQSRFWIYENLDFEICVPSLIWRKVTDAAIPLQPDLQLQDPDICKRENKK